MKISKLSREAKRLIVLSALCGCLLLTLLYMRQHRALQQAVVPDAVASVGVQQAVTVDQSAAEAQQASSIAAYRRLSYGEAIGMQHERSNNAKSKAAGKEIEKSGLQTEQTEKKQVEKEAQTTAKSKQEQLTVSQAGPVIAVRLSESNEVEHVPIEQYVLGVALAELPGSFEPEAVKAQMLAIRTYIVYRLFNNGTGELSGTYEVTDTTADQVYMPLKQVQQYEADYPQYYQKFVQALQDTEGLIISYKQQPIDALFFSTSNGYTEDAEQLWGKEVAYLQSVASPWDEQVSPKYETAVQLTFADVYEKLNLKQSRRNGKLALTHVAKNDSGRIQSLEVNGASFTGKELREKLGLSSTAMTWSIDRKQQTINIVCYGYGHGVGMSQWGADGMAKQGYQADEIVKHYYTDVAIEQASKLAAGSIN